MWRKSIMFFLVVMVLGGCSSRQVQDSMVGSTAQRLVTHSIDQLMAKLPASDFEPLRGKSIILETHFVENGPLKDYADERLAVALNERFDIKIATSPLSVDALLKVFYTSLGTDQELAGFYLPLGIIPGQDPESRINLISLEKFHGVTELYYYMLEDGELSRGPTLISRTRTDALGLPIITVPISRLPGD